MRSTYNQKQKIFVRSSSLKTYILFHSVVKKRTETKIE